MRDVGEPAAPRQGHNRASHARVSRHRKLPDIREPAAADAAAEPDHDQQVPHGAKRAAGLPAGAATTGTVRPRPHANSATNGHAAAPAGARAIAAHKIRARVSTLVPKPHQPAQYRVPGMTARDPRANGFRLDNQRDSPGVPRGADPANPERKGNCIRVHD